MRRYRVVVFKYKYLASKVSSSILRRINVVHCFLMSVLASQCPKCEEGELVREKTRIGMRPMRMGVQKATSRNCRARKPEIDGSAMPVFLLEQQSP